MYLLVWVLLAMLVLAIISSVVRRKLSIQYPNFQRSTVAFLHACLGFLGLVSQMVALALLIIFKINSDQVPDITNCIHTCVRAHV